MWALLGKLLAPLVDAVFKVFVLAQAKRAGKTEAASESATRELERARNAEVLERDALHRDRDELARWLRRPKDRQ